MKIYGNGTLTYPGSSRVVWDFTDGPFDTYNQILITAAKDQGFSFDPPVVEPDTVQNEIIPCKAEEPKDTPNKRGRKPKGVINVNA